MKAKKTDKKPAKNGRPSKFDTIDLKVVEKCVRKGFTDEEISEILSITVRTFHNWKKQYEKFFHSLKDWKKYADEKVERSLYKRATGYKCDDTHVSFGKEGVILTPLIKHYPPDPTSMIFWLKNRQPAKWRDRIEVSNLSETELERLREIATQEMKQNL